LREDRARHKALPVQQEKRRITNEVEAACAWCGAPCRVRGYKQDIYDIALREIDPKGVTRDLARRALAGC